MNVGILGGTFNPIHMGHLRAALEVRERVDLDKVLFVPCFIPPHKVMDGPVPAQKRLEMVSIAVGSNPAFDVSSCEIEKKGTSYSINTIEYVRAKYDTTPYFILGMDAFNDISTWFEFDRLFELSHFVVMSRPGTPKRALGAVLGDLSSSFNPTKRGYINKAGCEIIFVEITNLDISSSGIRELLKKGRSIKYLVPETLEDYIKKEGFYR